ncbi:MAG: glycosyl hydrolase [Coxiellaceae bacterium]|nr:glycosyl hydrolase [Coxiellaceae bacterium]
MSNDPVNAWNISYNLPENESAVTNWQGVPISPLVTNDISQAIPTNDWWSSLVMPHFDDLNSAPMYAHPLTLKAQTDGLDFGYNTQLRLINSDDISHVKYEYTYHSDVSVGLRQLQSNVTNVADYSDWAVTAQWGSDNGVDQLQATFGHGMPFVYFEREGNADVQISLHENNSTAIGQPNASVETLELTGVNGHYNGGDFDFNLQVNAVGADNNHIGNAVQARVSVDSSGDGQYDFIQTYNFIPLDGDQSQAETYNASEERGSGAEQIGELQNLNNAMITFEVWQAFGDGDIELSTGDASQLILPFDDLHNQNGSSVAAAINIVDESAGDIILGGQSDTVWHQSDNILGVTINNSHYGLFSPTDSQWNITDEYNLSSDLAGKDYFSIAVLPDNAIETLDYFSQHAYAFIDNTEINYEYDQYNSQVVTDFTIATDLKEEGFSDTALVNLYRHQWTNTDAELTEHSYQSPRGEMKLIEANSFSTTHDYSGILPALPNVQDETQVLYQHIDDAYNTLLNKPVAITAEDTYWAGKDMAKYAELAEIADQVGHTTARDYFVNTVKAELQDWFVADSSLDGDKQFYYNSEWGTLQGYPASFDSETQINDHHFHYGYFIKSAAVVAQFDPQWAADWGGAVDLLISDVANVDRSNTDYPLLRNFDPYAGHSWASGHGAFASGNNHESSSESMNFSSATMLWGAATGNDQLVELGAYLYATELAAIEQYWFDIDDAVFPQTFSHDSVGMVWGDGAAYATWFSAEPEMIHGINFLPLTGASLYLGRDAEYANQNYQEIISDNGGAANQWVDIIWQYQALSDPDAALVAFNATPNYQAEGGESYAHTFHWLNNLHQLGQVDATITADTPFYAVFNNSDLLTYAAYNPADQNTTVTYSDGTQIELLAGEFIANNASVHWSSIDGAVEYIAPPVEEGVPDVVPEAPEVTPEVPVTATQQGTDNNELLHGTSANDVLDAKAGDDQLHGNVGDDALYAGAGNDHLYGNVGDDILVGGLGADFLVGGAGADTYVYQSVSDSTAASQDRIETFESGMDRFDLSALNLQYSDLSADIINGFTVIQAASNDFSFEVVTPYQLSESDFIFAANGEMTPVGSEPEPEPEPEPDMVTDNLIQGDDQANHLHGSMVSDQMYAFAGDDHVHGNGGDDVILAAAGNDHVHGNDGDDSLSGDAGNDFLHGNSGNDILMGGAGGDWLYGNEDDDVLYGGLGKDFMVGGSGNDRFAYHTFQDSTATVRDIIEGFESGKDTLDFSALGVDGSDVSIQQAHGNYYVSFEHVAFEIELIATASLSIDDMLF